MSIRRSRYFCLLAGVIIIACATVYTAEAIVLEPRFNNTISASSSASISDDGLLTVTNQFKGIKGATSKGDITTYVEKKSGLTWKRVIIGQPDNEWHDIVNDYTYIGSHTVQLNSRGTYRITVVYVISGSGGDPDTITRTISKVY